MPQSAQVGIEDILYRQGAINASQLSAIKLEAINSGQPVEKIILQHQIVPPSKIGAARAQLLGVPFISLEGKGVSVEVLNYVPEAVARRYHLMPFDKKADKLFVAMEDPLDLQVIQFIEKKSGLFIKPYLALPEDIAKSVNEQYAQNLTSEVTSALEEVSSFQKNEEPQEEKAEIIREAPVANIISQLLDYAVRTKSSDIHIEPMEDRTRVRYRIDGILHEKVVLPRGVHDALVSRIKILSNLKIEEKRLPQDGRFSYTSGKAIYDLRVSTVPTIYGEKVVMRLLPKSVTPPTLQELGLRGTALKNLDIQITRPHGIILICGPTGSGKTTTLYSILTRLSTTKVNVLTVEDPVEYRIPGANQVQVNPLIGLTFADALRSFLRQDPNIMLVGEIRDNETADLAIQAALTGHEVFSTLHTNTAAGALPRLLDMGMEPFLLASSINGVVGQRILRKICPSCKQEYTPPDEVVQNIRGVLGKLLSPERAIKLYKGAGCAECGNTGYQGRIGIFEVLVVSNKIMNLILERASSQKIEDVSIEEGMITLKQDGYLKALEGVTALEEVLRVAED
ncbi:Flp pilus assembly complex ATPase component TadA [Patescibacteria group bacterium]|nr:Flp pilus assembly complex ATPase component TadA [Patescibacteria group bacterium]MCL5409926.1 Flp pilus assembly complex ATPase component TadA [Patescibacteria group bacterium]